LRGALATKQSMTQQARLDRFVARAPRDDDRVASLHPGYGLRRDDINGLSSLSPCAPLHSRYARRCFTSHRPSHAHDKLVWFEVYNDVTSAIAREKELKKWRRDWKIRLIEEENPGWVDLYPGISN